MAIVGGRTAALGPKAAHADRGAARTVIVVGRDLSVRNFTPGGERIFRIDPATVGRPLSAVPTLLENSGCVDHARQAIESGEILEDHVRTIDGGSDFTVTIMPCHGRDGGVEGALLVFTDVTAERAARNQRELMLRQMNHRIQNLFAVVNAMIAICAREATSIDDLVADLGGRIAAMGRAHALTQEFPVPQPIELAALVETVIAPSRAGQKMIIDGPGVTIPQKLVTPLALIFHEWAGSAANTAHCRHPRGS